MENKKQYIQPELKSVEFEVELGFAASLRQGMQRYDASYDGGHLYYNNDPFNVNKAHGFFHGNNDDWD